MRRVVWVVFIGVLIVSACKKNAPTETILPPAKPQLMARAINDGADLELTWTGSENAEEYVVYGDGSFLVRTTYPAVILNGTDGVYSTVKVCAKNELYRSCSTLDLTPRQDSLKGVVSSNLPGNSWVRIVFRDTISVEVIPQSEVDPFARRTAYFVLYYNEGVPELRDISATSLSWANIELAFNINARGDLAPGYGAYSNVQEITEGGFYFFWADYNGTGNGVIDTNDYFGAVEVTRLDTSGIGYEADFVIYVQHNVPGLRWMKI